MTCISGAKWPCAPCAKCRAQAAELEAEFWRHVFFGVFDRDGFTKADRFAEAQRKQEAA